MLIHYKFFFRNFDFFLIISSENEKVETSKSVTSYFELSHFIETSKIIIQKKSESILTINFEWHEEFWNLSILPVIVPQNL